VIVGIEGEMAEVDVGEEEVGLPAGEVMQADAFAVEGLADMVVVPFMREVSAMGNNLHLEVLGIDQRSVILVLASCAGMVEIGRALHLQCLMGALVIIDMAPALEGPLLGWEGGRRRLGDLGFKITMHAFVRAVVLGRGGPGELNLDSLLDPPDAQAGQASKPGGGEGRSQIAADDLWLTDLAHQGAAGAQGGVELLVELGAQGQQVAGVAIADGQGIAALSVAQGEPALEIKRPDFVGLSGLGEAVVESWIGTGVATAPHAQAVPGENAGDGTAGRRCLDLVLGLEDDLELLGAPGAVQQALSDDEGFHLDVGALWRVLGSMAAWPQPVEPFGRVAGQVLVAGLPADPKLLAQIGDRETVRLRQRNKANEFFHRAYSGPGHGALCVSHLPGLSVSYLAGSNRRGYSRDR
jgi:hypothetical protein